MNIFEFFRIFISEILFSLKKTYIYIQDVNIFVKFFEVKIKN